METGDLSRDSQPVGHRGRGPPRAFRVLQLCLFQFLFHVTVDRARSASLGTCHNPGRCILLPYCANEQSVAHRG